jgi:hypothetical protein
MSIPRARQTFSFAVPTVLGSRIFTTEAPSFQAKEVVSVLATWSERLSGELLYPSRYRHGYLNGTRSGHFSKRILYRDETVPVILRIGALGLS